jgi:hypothetical protein
MTTRTRIAAFAVVLGASFGAGALAGASVEPLRQGDAAHPPATPAPARTGAPAAATAPAPGHGAHGGADPVPGSP